MPIWSDVSDETLPNVEGRLTLSDAFSANTRPTLNEVDRWLDEAEAKLRASLREAELPDTYSAGSDAALLLGALSVDYAEARVRNAWATARGDGTEDGEAVIQRFNATLDEIAAKPSRWGSMLNVVGAAPSGSRLFRSNQTEGLTEDPVFEVGDLDGAF